jgi:hypothetical protein
MKRKIFLRSLFWLSALWVGAIITFGLLMPWSWGRVAVIAYAAGIAFLSFTRYYRYDSRQAMTELKHFEAKESIRVGNIALSQIFFFLVAFLPWPWTLSDDIIILIAGGAWLDFMRRDINVHRRKRGPALQEMDGPISLLAKR